MPTPTGQDLEIAIRNMKACEADREHFYKLEEDTILFIDSDIKFIPPNTSPEVYDMENERDEYEENECWRDNK